MDVRASTDSTEQSQENALLQQLLNVQYHGKEVHKKNATRRETKRTFSRFVCFLVSGFFLFPYPLFEPQYYKHRKDFPIYIWSTKGHSLEEFLTLGTAELLAGK